MKEDWGWGTDRNTKKKPMFIEFFEGGGGVVCVSRVFGRQGGGELALFGGCFGAVVGGACDLLFEGGVFCEEGFVVVAEACVFAVGVVCSDVCLVGGACVVCVLGCDDAGDGVDELLGCLFDWCEFLVGVLGCEGECVELHRGSSCV